MSGTYQIDGFIFKEQPLQKQWQRTPIGRLGNGEPVYSAFWDISLSFGTLELGTGTSTAQFMQYWVDNKIHSAVLPHPVSGSLTVFSGIAIDEIQYAIGDFDVDAWVSNLYLKLSHITLNPCWSVPNQPTWWMPEEEFINLNLTLTSEYYSERNWVLLHGSPMVLNNGYCDAELVSGTYIIELQEIASNFSQSIIFYALQSQTFLITQYNSVGGSVSHLTEYPFWAIRTFDGNSPISSPTRLVLSSTSPFTTSYSIL